MKFDLAYQLYRIKYHYGRYLPLKVPVDVSLELASVCDLRCGYCYHGDKANLPFRQGFMSLDIASKIIRQAAACKVNSLKMNWRGESTLNPNFEKITALAKSLAGGSVFIERLTNSNFNFENDNESIFRGLANQTKVKVSCDSLIPEVMAGQRIGSNPERIYRNIDRFYNWPNRQTELVIQAVRTQANKDEDLAGEIQKRWPGAGISIRDVVGGRTEKDTSKYEVRSRDSSERQACRQAFVRLIFDWRGDAGGCCPNINLGNTHGKPQINFGSITNKSLLEIFNSAGALALRSDLKSKKAFESDPCKNCSSFETFKNYRASWGS